MTTVEEKTPTAMWSAALLITLQSFLFGYCFSALNPCLVTGDNNSGSDCYKGLDSTCPDGSIYNDLNLTTIEAQLATSLTVAVAWIGCMVGSYPSEKYGRRITLLANNIFFIVGCAIAASGSLPALYVGRIIMGFGAGITSVVPPVLLAEMSSEATRGLFTTFHQLMLTVGIFVVNMIGFGFVTYVNHGWQYIQGLAVIPALAMLVMHAYVPESPKWLLAQYSLDVHSQENDHTMEDREKHPQYQEARSTLQRLRGAQVDVTEELQMLLDEVSQDKSADRHVPWSEVFRYKKALVIGCGLLFYQAFTGINTVVFYSTTIFGLAGFDQSIVGSACWSFVNVVMTCVAARLIDSAGRRVLLLGGIWVQLGALILLSGILLADVNEKDQGYVAVVAVLIYVCGFAVSLGAVPWTIISEIMPTRQRQKAVSLFLSINWGANLLIGLLTLTSINSLGGVKSSMDDDEQAHAETKGVGYLYLIFGILTFTSGVFVHVLVPETKGMAALGQDGETLSGKTTTKTVESLNGETTTTAVVIGGGGKGTVEEEEVDGTRV